MGHKKDTTNFFTTETERSQYWADYLTARPDYTQNNFYEALLQYHHTHHTQSHPGKSIAHDVGTGPGQVAAVLSGHFDAIVASDLNESHLAIAQKRLGRSLDGASLAKISFERLAAENVHSAHPSGSAALVAVGETMPLLDHAKALHSWATLLKPGGTLAIWFYGRPHFTPDETYDASACQQIYDVIADAMFAKYIKNGSGPAHTAGWKRATDCMSSFLDNVDLDPETWIHVRRWKWNTDCEMSFYGPEACDFDIEAVSRIRSEEQVDVADEPGFWGKQWNVDDWKLFLKMNLPSFRQGDVTPDIQSLWTELGEKMGGRAVRHGVRWPVVTLLATKA